MTSALIGHTGFVGRNLAQQRSFDACFNSANFRDLAGRTFDLLVCAGVPASAWRANRDPKADWRRIAPLIDVLRQTTARRVVVISTTEVYPNPNGVDEADAIDAAGGQPHGRHRRRVELAVQEQFPDVFVFRLCGLFGPGLKQNVLFDLLNATSLAAVNPANRLQWYNVGRLWRDIERCIAQDLRLVNLVTEPVQTADILARYFPRLKVGGEAPAVVHDVRTRHAAKLGGTNGYLAKSGKVLAEIGAFIGRATARAVA